ncbi:hypothetical protein ABID59_002137 [Bradyrhizobium sp. S3.3.6]|uniref:hypothetical protein n=1 Tax=Bradyrhizobium sp. S3.3.6 TaxID=3156429 RepID=UPI003399D290
MRRVEQRATGQFLRIRTALGTVITIPGWMVDPIACAEMTSGPPQVDLAALSELKRLVTALAISTNSPSDRVAWENADEAGARSCTDFRRATEPDIRRLDRMNEAARLKALLTLAQILMQAAGLVVEELGDARH